MGAARLDAMLGHLGINVPDLVAAKRYYDALMPLVGFEPFFGADDEFAYRPAGNKPGTYLFFYPAAESGEYSSQRTGLQHLAFIVRARSLVENGTTMSCGLVAQSFTSLSISRSTPAITTPRSGTTRSASNSKPSATTTTSNRHISHLDINQPN